MASASPCLAAPTVNAGSQAAGEGRAKARTAEASWCREHPVFAFSAGEELAATEDPPSHEVAARPADASIAPNSPAGPLAARLAAGHTAQIGILLQTHRRNE